MVICQAMVPTMMLILLPTIPESPRWYIQHNKTEHARKSLRTVRKTEWEVEDEILMIREAIKFEKEAISGSYAALVWCTLMDLTLLLICSC